MATIKFQTLDRPKSPFTAFVLVNAVALVAGLAAALYMESRGHVVTGMTNQVVWGLPHVFAVFLIVSASGALNLASISSVFGREAYKPYARLSAVLAIALLAGGLAVLVLDLGRADRLAVAMTTYNFRSIFAWNVYLYTGFMAVVGAYLFAMTDRGVSKDARVVRALGTLAFVWRLVLTTGTGSIFGFLVAREAYHGPMMAPLFVAASLYYGLAFATLVLALMGAAAGAELVPDEMAGKFRGLLTIFALATAYFVAAHFLTKLYATADRPMVMFLLRDGGPYPLAFWGGEILLGTVGPLLILWRAGGRAADLRKLAAASALVLFGGLCQMYVFIVGGQAWPLDLFPGYRVSSSFYDGAINAYSPSLPEALLGIGGVALAMLIVALAVRTLPFLPKTGAARDAAGA
ncbi:MAG: polysulfide reductase NrfD [Hyphomicrobiales bacterium]|nr:polysulfide reductase NrfD [Hyphomicrobiales bacterium]MDE2018036.1 polysulfide reductase NrfD [Hyphomicrobiales bacterium]